MVNSVAHTSCMVIPAAHSACREAVQRQRERNRGPNAPSRIGFDEELSDGLWRRVFAGTLSDERSAIHTIYGVRWLLLLCGAGVLEDGLQSFERRLLLMLERCLERGEPRLERRRPSAGGEALLEIGEP